MDLRLKIIIKYKIMYTKKEQIDNLRGRVKALEEEVTPEIGKLISVFCAPSREKISMIKKIKDEIEDINEKLNKYNRLEKIVDLLLEKEDLEFVKITEEVNCKNWQVGNSMNKTTEEILRKKKIDKTNK